MRDKWVELEMKKIKESIFGLYFIFLYCHYIAVFYRLSELFTVVVIVIVVMFHC